MHNVYKKDERTTLPCWYFEYHQDTVNTIYWCHIHHLLLYCRWKLLIAQLRISKTWCVDNFDTASKSGFLRTMWCKWFPEPTNFFDLRSLRLERSTFSSNRIINTLYPHTLWQSAYDEMRHSPTYHLIDWICHPPFFPEQWYWLNIVVHLADCSKCSNQTLLFSTHVALLLLQDHDPILSSGKGCPLFESTLPLGVWK